MVGFYYWLYKRQMGGGLGGLMGVGGKLHKPVDPESVRVTFDDVAGIDEVEAEIAEIVDYLEEPERYRRLGARAPKGVLLAGPPARARPFSHVRPRVRQACPSSRPVARSSSR